jgi:anti-sigma-K factor RskA
LRLNVQELDEAIIRWSERVATFHENLHEKQPSSHVWKRIERSIFPPSRKIKVDKFWWSSVIFWQVTGVGASLASLILLVTLSTDLSKPDMLLPLISSTPSYTAVMSSNSNGLR